MNVDTYTNASQQILSSLPYRAYEGDQCGVTIARAILTALPANTSTKEKLHIWTSIYRSFWPTSKPEREPEPLTLTLAVGSISIWSGNWHSEIADAIDLTVYQQRAREMLYVQQRKQAATQATRMISSSEQTTTSSSWFSPLSSSSSSSDSVERTSIREGMETQSRLETHFSRHLPFFPSALFASCMAQLSLHLFSSNRRYIEIPLFSRDPYLTHEVFRLLWKFFCSQTQTHQKAFLVDDSNAKVSRNYLRQTMGDEKVLEELPVKNLERLIDSFVENDIVMLFVLTDQTNLSASFQTKINSLNLYATHIEIDSIMYPNSCKVIVMYCAGTSEVSLSEPQAFDNFHSVFFPPEIKPPPPPGVLGFKARWEFPSLPKAVLIQWTIAQFQHKLRAANRKLEFLNSDLHVCLEQEPLQTLLDVFQMSEHLFDRFTDMFEDDESHVYTAGFDPIHPTILAIDGKPFLTVPQPLADLGTFPVETSSSQQIANLQTHFNINDPQQAQQAVQRFTTNTFRLCSRDQNPQVFAEAFLDDHKKQVQDRLDMQVVVPQRGDLQLIYDDNGLVFMQNDQRRFAQFPVSVYARVIADLYHRQQKLEDDFKEIKEEVRAIKAQENQPKLITDRKRKAESIERVNRRTPGNINFIRCAKSKKIRALRIVFRDKAKQECRRTFSLSSIKHNANPKEFIASKAIAYGVDAKYTHTRVEEIFAMIDVQD